MWSFALSLLFPKNILSVLRVSFVVCIALVLGFFSFLHDRQYANDARNAAARKGVYTIFFVFSRFVLQLVQK